MDTQTVWGIIGAIGSVASLFALGYQLRKPKHVRGIKKLSAEKRLELLAKVLKSNSRLTINIDACLFIFMPNGENIFGAGWTNYEWVEFLERYIEKNPNERLTVGSLGETYYLADLISGKNIRIPVGPQKGMTIDQDGAAVGQVLMFVKY